MDLQPTHSLHAGIRELRLKLRRQTRRERSSSTFASDGKCKDFRCLCLFRFYTARGEFKCVIISKIQLNEFIIKHGKTFSDFRRWCQQIILICIISDIFGQSLIHPCHIFNVISCADERYEQTLFYSEFLADLNLQTIFHLNQ